MVAQQSSGVTRYDVIIIGGALSGASAAILLLREHPELRVLIIEKGARFTRKVGEATVEVSAYFLGRVLGLTQHMNQEHLVKQGMRFWFANDEARTLEEASEIGGRYNVRLPSYQLDRAVFDEEVLARAVAAGAELRRPASVSRVTLEASGSQCVALKTAEGNEEIWTRWVIDASGVAALLARQEKWWRANEAHPTSACWARWRGVKDWDGLELAAKYPAWARQCFGLRGTATNHVVGDGWWSWWIPLKGDEVSVGVVFDQRLVEWRSEGGSLGERLKAFLLRHPVGEALLCDAEFVEDDVHWRRNLPYSSTTFAGDGFALVGDAAAFMDPLYSPGMDWISYTVWSAVALISAQRSGDEIAPLVARHNARFSRSYERWFTAIYQDKYEYLGDFELFRVAFTLDLGLYYLGIVSQPFLNGPSALLEPPFSTAPSTPPYYLIRTYNRRFAAMARERRRRGVHGRANASRKHLINGFTLARSDARLVVKALWKWLWLELTEGWRTWFGASPVVCAEPPLGTSVKPQAG